MATMQHTGKRPTPHHWIRVTMPHRQSYMLRIRPSTRTNEAIRRHTAHRNPNNIHHTTTKTMKDLIPCHRKYDISFHHDGKIDIRAHVVRTLGIHEGDVISICQSDDTPHEYYLYVRIPHDKTEGAQYTAQCRRTVTNGRRSQFLRAYSKALTDAILKIVGTTDAYLMTGELRTDLPGVSRALTLITRTNLKPTRDN